ncbi:hypothetical protein HID58_049093 [Brassica napus]|uniref:Uncharacterized protein n=1 Tax=Brassica napus TaxID=3708 RepID=A0ABQ8B401_BRANA|nr:hypothetical protein HID58_049093 [Brassica napus]
MKDRGKRTAMERRNDDVSLHYSSPSELSCGKHPSVSTVGICPYCLNDRLVNLVCSGCGEQRLSSCSCSDISSNRTSNAAVDAEKVLRIASLIDEEATKQRKPKRTEEVVVFKRSSSSCVEINKTKHHHRFSRLGRFFRRINPRKDRAFDEKNNNDNDSWVLKQSVSRSRSLCSFRGGNGYLIGSEEDVSSYSGARSSFSAARSSSVNGGLGVFDATITEHRRSNFEGRKSNFTARRRSTGGVISVNRSRLGGAVSRRGRVTSVKQSIPGRVTSAKQSINRVSIIIHVGAITKRRQGRVTRRR